MPQRTLIGRWPVKHDAPTYPIRAEIWRYRVRVPDEKFESFEDAAEAAAMACEWNTHVVERAWNTETGEEWNRKTLLDVGAKRLGF